MKSGWIISVIGVLLFVVPFYLFSKGIINIFQNLWILGISIFGGVLFFLGLWILKENLTKKVWHG